MSEIPEIIEEGTHGNIIRSNWRHLGKVPSTIKNEKESESKDRMNSREKDLLSKTLTRIELHQGDS